MKRVLFITFVILAAGVCETRICAQTSYAQFKHDNPNHSRLPCLLCHRRPNNDAQPTLPGKDQHAPCTGCHQQQFANHASEICSICHTDAQSGKMKPFPALRSFNVRFDHAKHSAAGADCAKCHRRSRGGVALSIPARLNAHAICFSCHTPGAKAASGRDISSCGTCHQLGGFVRTSEQAAAYRVGFSHAKHDASERLTCVECHKVRPGLAQGRQVSAPVALNHRARAGTTSCATCHNSKRAFGGDDFSVCTRCHKGSQWRF
jgi:c(7)-type cytochrome triheme protein